jgi:hypothetical protein
MTLVGPPACRMGEARSERTIDRGEDTVDSIHVSG